VYINDGVVIPGGGREMDIKLWRLRPLFGVERQSVIHPPRDCNISSLIIMGLHAFQSGHYLAHFGLSLCLTAVGPTQKPPCDSCLLILLVIN